MTDAEMNSYRFGSGEEPTDEMLAQIMREAAIDAAKRFEEANKAYFDELRRGALAVEEKWKDRISRLKK